MNVREKIKALLSRRFWITFPPDGAGLTAAYLAKHSPEAAEAFTELGVLEERARQLGQSEERDPKWKPGQVEDDEPEDPRDDLDAHLAAVAGATAPAEWRPGVAEEV